MSLYRQKYGYGEAGFFGAIVAVISAASGAVTTAMYSGGVAAGANVFPSHYNYEVQIYNYKAAATAANCMYEVINLLDNDIVLMINASEPLYNEVGNELYQNLEDLAYELEIKQAGVTLITPNLDALAAAVRLNQQNEEGLATIKNHRGYDLSSQNNRDTVISSVKSKLRLCRLNMSDKPS
ncbi:Uncharacterised protein [Serratia entomophila]|nr:Uncharacterised protein [Serratia entomophila]CAI1555254.1 Uncharacterised protein [Serratia entomophila]CAI1655223.1 Uncharacterised protein [Serratia entomophila]CAI1711870.1 Uncharacterised protein [Serratia entomophila]CAI1796585.1 Uncharacterised protein [Serratia entomophila]